MARFSTAVALLLATAAAPAALAFIPSSSSPPLLRNTANNNLKMSEVDYDAPILANPQSGTAVLDQAPVVDDECYMGAEGQFDDCVDFDPPKVRRRTRSANAQDQPRAAPSWTAAWSRAVDDFDAPVPLNPASASKLDHDPVVDDECYMGAEGQFDDCVDFDPPVVRRRTRSANAHDQARSQPKWTVADDFDAPVPLNPASATDLDHDPVVDDECYMGADGQFDDCVDFDPPKQANLWTNVLDTPKGQKQRELPKWAQQR